MPAALKAHIRNPDQPGRAYCGQKAHWSTAFHRQRLAEILADYENNGLTYDQLCAKCRDLEPEPFANYRVKETCAQCSQKQVLGENRRCALCSYRQPAPAGSLT